MNRLRTRAKLGLAISLAGLTMAAAGCAPATTLTVTRVPVTRAFGAPIEANVPYQPAAKKCVKSNSYDKPGPIAFRNLLLATYGTNVGGLPVFTGITRPCTATISEHAEGRALDWGMDYRNATMRATGKAVLGWLFATDTFGNKDAIARRLGIMYVIWNHQMFGSWNDYQPAKYACGTDPTACHVDHIHFSFDWAGAKAQTSFFSGKVA